MWPIRYINYIPTEMDMYHCSSPCSGVSTCESVVLAPANERGAEFRKVVHVCQMFPLSHVVAVSGTGYSFADWPSALGVGGARLWSSQNPPLLTTLLDSVKRRHSAIFFYVFGKILDTPPNGSRDISHNYCPPPH